MEKLGMRQPRPTSSQYQRLGRSESLDRLLGSAAWAKVIEPAAAKDNNQLPQQAQGGRGRLLRTRSLPDLLGFRRRAVHWKALSWFLDPGSRRKVGSLEYLKDMGKAAPGGRDESCRSTGISNLSSFSKTTLEGGGGGGDDRHKSKKQQRQKNKKRSSWLPDPEKRWPIQGW